MEAEEIVEAVAWSYGISLSDLKSRKRDAYIVEARQLAMYLILQDTGCTLARAGPPVGGRVPATVSYAYNKIGDSLPKSYDLRYRINAIRRKVQMEEIEDIKGKPWAESLWTDCLFELVNKARKEGKTTVNFADVDNLVLQKSKLIIEYKVET